MTFTILSLHVKGRRGRGGNTGPKAISLSKKMIQGMGLETRQAQPFYLILLLHFLLLFLRLLLFLLILLFVDHRYPSI